MLAIILKLKELLLDIFIALEQGKTYFSGTKSCYNQIYWIRFAQ